jgi:hypothetical protein
MFGDYYWVSDRTEEQFERYGKWKRKLADNDSLVVIEIGAGLDVPTVRTENEGMGNITGWPLLLETPGNFWNCFYSWKTLLEITKTHGNSWKTPGIS